MHLTLGSFSLKDLWDSGKTNTTGEESSIWFLNRFHPKVCLRLRVQFEKHSLVWWAQSGAFWPSDLMLWPEATKHCTSPQTQPSKTTRWTLCSGQVENQTTTQKRICGWIWKVLLKPNPRATWLSFSSFAKKRTFDTYPHTLSAVIAPRGAFTKYKTRTIPPSCWVTGKSQLFKWTPSLCLWAEPEKLTGDVGRFSPLPLQNSYFQLYIRFQNKCQFYLDRLSRCAWFKWTQMVVIAVGHTLNCQ